MTEVEKLVRQERQRLCIAYSYAYVETAVITGREHGRDAEALVVQPYKQVFFRSAAEAAEVYRGLQGAAVPILFSPHGRHEEQFLTHIGRVLRVERATEASAEAVRTGLGSGRLLAQSPDEPVYSKGSFLFVHPRIDRLPQPVPLSILQNALGKLRGQATGALHIPAPKLIAPEWKHLLELAPETWETTEEWAAPKVANAAPCGKCRATLPRDELMGLNPRWWNASGAQTRIRIRLCAPCMEEVTSYLRRMEWDPSEQVPLQSSG